MTMATITALDKALQDVYLPGIREQFSQLTGALYNALPKPTNANFQGRKIVHGIHVGRNPSFGSRDEMEDLPEAGHQRYEQIETGVAHHYAGINYTGQLIKQARTHPGAFINVTQMEAPMLAQDLAIQCNRQIFNTKDGYLAIASGVAVGQDVPVQADLAQWISLNIGQRCDIGTAADPVAGADSVVISGIDEAAGTITFTGSVASVANGHFIRIEDSYRTADQRSKELFGLRELIDSTGALFGLDPANEPVWQSYHDSGAGAASLAMFQTMLDSLQRRTGMAPRTAYTTHKVCTDMGNLLETNKRYVNVTELDGGHTAINVSTGSGTISLVADRFVPDGEAFMPYMEDLVWNAMTSDWEWMQEDGAILERVPNKDAYQATIFNYSQLTTVARFRHGRISGIT